MAVDSRRGDVERGMIGTELSHFRITAELGSGAMGVVYRAEDMTLGREVALKVLPEEMAADPERLERFKREAQAIAALSHPNIVTIHSVEVADGVNLLTMELVEGKSLDQLLPAGGFELDKLFPLAIQIADALAAAHEKGIVHRDLKPANVMVTDESRVKVLDFGLAKLAESEGEDNETQLMTKAGMVLGTVPYMSPEGVQGQPVDHRSDIFSLGILLYEMATGERPFQGDNPASVISAVLKEHPPAVTEVKADLPNHLGRIVRRCLEKLPQRRYQSAREIQLELEALESELRMTAGAHTTPPLTMDAEAVEPPVVEAASMVSAGHWIGAVAVVGLAAAFGGWWLRGQNPDRVERWSHFTQLTDMEGAETQPSLSPDGGSFAYSSRAAGSWDIYVQRVGGRNPIAVAADPERDEVWPAFSPDGRLIAYNESDRDGGIWVVGATGESDHRVTDFGFNPAWSPDGKQIAFASGPIDSPYERGKTSALWRVPAVGGEPVQLSEKDAVQPAYSPSGARIAVWFHEGGQRDLATLSADGGERLVLLEDAPLDWSPTWSPDGKYLYFSSDRGGTLGIWRLPIDEATGQARGEPESVANGLEASMSLPGFSTDGQVLVFRSETVSVIPVVIPFDPVTERAGAPRELLRRIGILRPTSVSPDGEWLALYNRGEPREDLFLMRTDGSELRRLIDDVARDRTPSFSPDGRLLLFHSNREGKYGGYSIRVDGSALTRLTDASIGNVGDVMLGPNGDRILFHVLEGGLMLARPPWPATSSAAERIANVQLPDGEWRPVSSAWSWSPDGRLLSGRLTRGSRTGIGVYDSASGEGRLVREEDGAPSVRWLPDSRRVVYFTQESQLAVLDVETADRRLVAVDLPVPLGDDDFAVAPDGTAIFYSGERVESNIWMVERGR